MLLAIVVKFCQRISGAGCRTEKYLWPLASAWLSKRCPPLVKTNLRIGLPSDGTE